MAEEVNLGGAAQGWRLGGSLDAPDPSPTCPPSIVQSLAYFLLDVSHSFLVD